MINKQRLLKSGIHLLFIFFITFYLGSVFDVSAEEWSQRAGGNYTGLCNSYSVSGGSEGGYSTTVDDSGNVYVTGLINSDADIFGVNLVSDGPWDTFVAKLDAWGDVVWAKQATGSSYVTNPAIDIDSNGNIFISGYFNNTANIFGTEITSNGNYDGYIAKFDTDGNVAWVHNFGGTSAEKAESVFLDNSDNVYIAGGFQGSGNFFGSTLTSAGSEDIFVVKLDNNGNGIWAKQAGGVNTDRADDVAVDNSGNVYLTGFFSTTADIFGTSLIAGGTETWANDIFVAKLDSSGVGQWAKRGGSDEDQRDYGDAIDVDDDGNIYITGRFRENADIFGQVLTGNDGNTLDNAFFVKLNSNGAIDWLKHWTGTSSASSRDIIVGSDNVYVAGSFSGTLNADSYSTTSNGAVDIFYGVLDLADGTVTHLESFGGSNYDAGEALAINSNGLVYFAGRFKGPMNMFGTNLTSYGCYDVFLSRIEDDMAPDRYDGGPSGEQPSGTTNANLQLNTENNATCGYSTVAGTPYTSMITMETTGTDVHIQNVTGLSDGNTYNYYIRCTNGNENTNDFVITFSIASATEIRADVDQNSTINSTDAILTLRNSLGLDMSSTNWVLGTHTGDVNCDDDSNSTDAMLILRKSLDLDMTGTGWCAE